MSENKKLADDLERLCCAETEGKFFDLVTDSIQTIIEALRRPALPQNDAEAVLKLEWRNGPPPKPWADEWFIARTTYGDRVVLTALPEEYTYDFKTADGTYIMADKIKRWMQFPSSQYVAPPPELERMRKALEYIVSQQWDENADLDDICQTAEKALSRAGDNHASELVETDDLPGVRSANDWDKPHWKRDNHASEPIIGRTALCGHGVMAAICAKCNHASDGKSNPVLGAESVSGAHVADRTAGANPATGAKTSDREAIARIIDPDTYHAYDIHKHAGTVAENGKPWCDLVCGKDIAAALAKADAILALRGGE